MTQTKMLCTVLHRGHILRKCGTSPVVQPWGIGTSQFIAKVGANTTVDHAEHNSRICSSLRICLSTCTQDQAMDFCKACRIS